jgi:hypothetical protein
MNVIVSHYSDSACANYIFMAESSKTVLPGALVGFHGAPYIGNIGLPITYTGPVSMRSIGVADAKRTTKVGCTAKCLLCTARYKFRRFRFAAARLCLSTEIMGAHVLGIGLLLLPASA